MSDSSDRAKSLVAALTCDGLYRMAVSEVTGQACDVLALRSGGEWVEFEIKTSRQDLRREIRAIEASLVPEAERRLNWSAYYLKYKSIANTKIQKHSIYLKPNEEHQLGNWKSFIPNKFYFAVTPQLEEYAINEVTKLKLPYGVATLNGTIIRNAKKLNGYIDYHTMVNVACRAFGEQPVENS